MDSILEELKQAEVYRVPVEKLKPNSWNPNEMGETAWKALGQSITKYGIHLQPIVVRPWGEDAYQIIDGEHRYKWAYEMGIKEVSIVVIDVDDFDAKKLTQILNRTRGEDNPVALKELLDSLLVDHSPDEVIEGLAIADETELNHILQDLEETIMSDYDLGGGDGLTEDDAIPEDAPTRCKRGDIWQLGRHRVMCGDSTSIDDVQRLMDGKEADLLHTDPPYGIKRAEGFEGFEGFGGFGTPIKRREYKGDKWDDDRPPKECFDIALQHSKIAVIWGGNFFADFLPQGKHWLVWDKKNTMPTFGDAELAWTNVKRDSVKIKEFTYNGLIGKEKERFHPTQKPLALIADITETYSQKDDLILDLFLGSGTTLIACEKTERTCYGMELSEKYCDVIIKRWEDFTGQTATKLA